MPREFSLKIKEYDISNLPDKIYCNQSLVEVLWDIHQEANSINQRKYIRGLAKFADHGFVSKKQYVFIKELAEFYQYDIEGMVFTIKRGEIDE